MAKQKRRLKNSPKRRTPKRSDDQRDRDRAYVSRLYLEGKRLDGIHKIINERLWPIKRGVNPAFPDVDYTLSRSEVYRDIRYVREQWAEAAVFNFDAFLNKELDKLDLIEAEAFEAWSRSKSRRVKNRVKKKEILFDMEGNEVKPGGEIAHINSAEMIQTTRELASESEPEPEGNPKFLQIVLNCQDRRLKLLGDTYALYLKQRAQVINEDGDAENLYDKAIFNFPESNRKKQIAKK